MIEYKKENKNHYYIEYDITMACNNRCSYCYVLNELDNKKLFNEDVFNKTTKAIKEFKTDDITLLVALFGGDPLMVSDKVVDFINILDGYCDFEIFTNLNFNPLSDNILNLHKIKNKSFKIFAPLHLSSNIEYFKNNVLTFKDNVTVSLIINDDYIDIQYENFKWLEENDIKFELSKITFLNGGSFNFKNEKYLEMKHSKNLVNNAGEEYEDMKYVAVNNMVSCNVSSLKIKYNGEITAVCGFPYSGSIEDGIPKLGMKFCKYPCHCDLPNFRLIGNKYKKTH